MLRLTVLEPETSEPEYQFLGDSVTIGRGPDNQLRLEDPAVSSHHGRIDVRGRHLVYVDLGSTNGTIVYRDGRALAITGRQVRGQLVSEQDRIKIGPYTLRIECLDARIGTHDPTVLESQALTSVIGIGGPGLTGLDPRQEERILALVTEGQATVGSFDRLCAALKINLLRLFPKSTHLSLVMRDPASGRLAVAYHDGRSGEAAEFRISHTILRRVMDEEAGVLVVDAGQQLQNAQSIVLGGIETAICAPLRNLEGTFGALQLDVRERKGERFDRDDLLLLVGVADLVALVLDNHRQHEIGRASFLSTMEALLREREEQDPAAVGRARRVRTLAIVLGRTLKLSEKALETLSAAASFTAWPRPRPPVLVHPDGLWETAFIASCRRERMDGSGPLGLTGPMLPLASRILALATAVVDRRQEMPAVEVMAEMEAGRETSWDVNCLDALRKLSEEIDQTLNGMEDRAA